MEARSASGGGLSQDMFYNKTLTTREFNDYGAINMGQACPIATANQEDEDNKFIANLAFEMPPQTAIEASMFQNSTQVFYLYSLWEIFTILNLIYIFKLTFY